MQTSYRIGFLMNAYETLNLETETSLLLMDELMSRGHVVYWLEQEGIALENGRLDAPLQKVVATAPFRLDGNEQIDVNRLDALIIRKDPPFDKYYLHLTYLLEFLDPGVVQVNSPAALRSLNEKIATLRWPEFCPETLVSLDPERLLAFANRFARIVIKPLDDCSGRGITFLRRNDPAARDKLAQLQQRHGFLMAQEYLDNVTRGDKRVYVAAGKPVGWVNRIPADERSLANIHQGATCAATSLTDREEQISLTVGGALLEEGILLAGLDFIDERLTEINVTSPSAVRQINAVTGRRVELAIVDAILAKIAAHPRWQPTVVPITDLPRQASE